MKISEQSQRQLKVSEEIRRVIAKSLLKDDLFIHGLKSSFIQITHANISPDLTYVAFFVNCVGNVDTDEQIKLLNNHKGVFRYIIGKSVRLRTVPDIVFKKDMSFEKADHIEALLNTPHVKQDLDG